jgi:hypothetical protein
LDSLPNIQLPEQVQDSEPGVRLYDGDERTDFDEGRLQLTPYRLFWSHGKTHLSLPLQYVAYTDYYEGFSFMSSPKIILHLSSLSQLPPNSASPNSKADHIKLSFRQSSGSRPKTFKATLDSMLTAQAWLYQPLPSSTAPAEVIVAERKGMGWSCLANSCQDSCTTVQEEQASWLSSAELNKA